MKVSKRKDKMKAVYPVVFTPPGVRRAQVDITVCLVGEIVALNRAIAPYIEGETVFATLESLKHKCYEERKALNELTFKSNKRTDRCIGRFVPKLINF